MIAEPVETTTEVELTRHRFTVAEYLRMAEVDLLGEDSRVELIWGEIVEMSPIYIAHTSTVKRLISLLTKKLGERIILGVQDPVQLSDDSLPQPDIAVLRPQDNFYGERQPGPDDIFLLIEVADTSLRYDRRVKSKLYGAAGIVDYWIVNLPGRQIEVYREPRPNGYRTVTHYAPGETLSPLAFADVNLSVDEIVGASD
jgi:Uma2 family endonuclease